MLLRPKPDLVNCVQTDVKQNIPDWKEYLMSKLVGANTLPVDFYIKVKSDYLFAFEKIMSTSIFSRKYFHVLLPVD